MELGSIVPGAQTERRGGGGLLHGKDPAGRFTFGGANSMISGFVAWFARSPYQRANGSNSFLARFLAGVRID